MRVLYVTSEVFPFVKTGGLADVSASLSVALRELGLDVRLLVPGYRQALDRAKNLKEVVRLGDPLNCGPVRLLETHLPHADVPVWFVDCPTLYDRAGGLYQTEHGADWPDNALRFALLNHVAAGIANETGRGWRPDLIHCNDWHAGLLPMLLASSGQPRQPILFTIHNLAYQGLFPAEEIANLDLPAGAFEAMEFYGRASFLKAGISMSDAITTVSPTYASEIMTPEYGCGMDGLLREKVANLTGILNGVDYRIWDPSTDPHIASNYSSRSLAPKADCKKALQTELGLDPDAKTPLVAFMSRLVHQKMPDVVLEAMPALIEEGVQFVLLGEGDEGYQNGFRELAARYPGQVGVEIGYRETMAHRVLAGADILLHPARFEPCGLVPIYALRYGTVPVVRQSGGMADTVVDASTETVRQGTATGFWFQEPSAEELATGIRRAVAVFHQPIAWRRLQAAGMRQDFSWQRSGDAYAELYRSLTRTPTVQPAESNAPETDEPAKLTA
ncbi:MAG TPA: glycogen synthase GlgA [Micropepsaceae bacterium]|nr:glycogen synthase GlgA [Micropepsaceae bacterium]